MEDSLLLSKSLLSLIKSVPNEPSTIDEDLGTWLCLQEESDTVFNPLPPFLPTEVDAQFVQESLGLFESWSRCWVCARARAPWGISDSLYQAGWHGDAHADADADWYSESSLKEESLEWYESFKLVPLFPDTILVLKEPEGWTEILLGILEGLDSILKVSLEVGLDNIMSSVPAGNTR